MKLIQLNIWQGRIIRHVARFLSDEQPDIVCLQEVCSAKEPVPGWDCFSSLEVIQKALPDMKYWFFAPLSSYSVHGRKVTAGNVIGSRLPISRQTVAFTNGHYVDGTDPEPNTRNFQSCQLELESGRQLSLINHHAYWDKNPLGTPGSVHCMQKVKDAARRMPQPLILCGDLNVLPESEAMQLFNGTLENLTETHHIETTLTSLGAAIDKDNIVACDHILISPGVSAQQFYASDKIVSDHKAMILEFNLD